MSDVASPPVAEIAEVQRLDAAAVARLRALSQPGFSARELAASVSRIEIAALVGLVLLVVGTVLVYSWVILPDQVRFVQLRNAVSENNTKIDDLKKSIDDPTAMTQQIDEVRMSLDTFRNATLKPRIEGRRAVIETVGRLSSETGAQLASAVQFETRDPRIEALEDAKRNRNVRDGEEGEIQSYPSLGVSFSVSGNYEQLRRFISRVEASDQFVVIEAINLGTEAPLGEEGIPRHGGQGGVVTLAITMTAFFQPEPVVGIQ
jgi:hypothetical protein